MGEKVDETGQTHGRLLVIQEDTRINKKHAYWSCLCSCGNVVTVYGLKLRSGHTSSCGCLRRKHGFSQTPEYESYQKMMRRCYDPMSENYEFYGGRGIQVCERWRLSIKAFMEDMGPKPNPDCTLDRINVNGDYSPGNCRWADAETQQRNKRVCKKSRTGIKGVIPYKSRFQAYIRVNGRLHHLGYFDTIGEAAEARAKAEKEYWGQEGREVMPK